MRIDQFVHTLTYGDAISGEAIAIRRLLRELGHESDIYVVNVHEKYEKIVRKWEKYSGSAGAALLLHYSLASPLNRCYMEQTDVTRLLLYHNLTPPHWFASYNDRVTRDLRRGFEELPQLLEVSDIVLADSSYNKEQLTELGCAHAQVFPLLLDREKWSVQVNQGIVDNLRSLGETNVLHVGRIAPNKRLEDIIKAFYFYHHKIEKKSKLWLVGNDIDTEIYSFELRRLVDELLLKEAVRFVGAVTDTELKGYFAAADLYLCMSEHEGFCVPLLEAMHFGVPIIAYNACAVGETLGESGVLLDDKSPALVAELMNIVCKDTTVRQRLVSAGKSRLDTFSEEQFSKNLQELTQLIVHTSAQGASQSINQG